MKTQVRITNGTHEDCVLAAAAVGKTKVVSCPNPADAASPVTLHSGNHSQPIGQSADYRHDLDPLMAIHGAALVQTWWDNDEQRWYTTIDGLDGHEDAIREFVAARIAERAEKEKKKQREQAEAQSRAESQQRRETIAQAIELARQAGERWAAGRIAVRMSNDREIIVGRWDAPNQPGYGKPAEVRRAVRGENDELILVPCSDSYRYTWG